MASEKRRQDKAGVFANLPEFESEVREAMPETKMDLERVIALLPTGAKEVLILHDIHGDRYREIADMASIAEGTVESQLGRARRLLPEA